VFKVVGMLWGVQGLRNEYLRELEWLFGCDLWGESHFLGLNKF